MKNYDKFKHSYVYRFDNIINGKWYIGARWNYYCKPEEDKYNSSSQDKEFLEALNNNELRKTIICEFNKDILPILVNYDGESLLIDDVVTLALWVEDQLIRSGWRKYGRKSSYNKRAQFKNNILFNSSSEALSKAQKDRWTDELRKEWSENYKGELNPFYGKHHTDEYKEIDRERSIELWKDPDFKKKMSDSHKGKIFIHKGDETKYILPSELDHYYELGYTRGRAHKCKHPRQNPNKGANISKSKKGKKQKRAKWIDDDGIIREMSVSNAKRYYPDWKFLEFIVPTIQ